MQYTYLNVYKQKHFKNVFSCKRYIHLKFMIVCKLKGRLVQGKSYVANIAYYPFINICVSYNRNLVLNQEK